MGTLLFSRGVPQRACLDELPATRPGSRRRRPPRVPRGRGRADRHALARREPPPPRGVRAGRTDVTRLNRRAAQVAREARDVAGRDALVGGSIGPLGVPTHELAAFGEARARSLFREQLDGLLEGGIDLVVLETHPDLEALLWAVDEARRAADLPILASLTFGEELTLPGGTTPSDRRRGPGGGRRRRHRRQLRCGSGRLPRRPRGVRSRGARPRVRARSCRTPVSRSGWRAASSTRQAPTTSPS